jgi:hypothetical protein
LAKTLRLQKVGTWQREGFNCDCEQRMAIARIV